MFLLTIYLPWLLNMLPYSYWALTCLAVLPTYSAFMISVRQASDLPPASFRFPVTQDTLALGYILPAVGRIGDFHPLKHAPAGRTKKSRQLYAVCFRESGIIPDDSDKCMSVICGIDHVFGPAAFPIPERHKCRNTFLCI